MTVNVDFKVIDALDILCAPLTRDLFAIAKLLLSYSTLNNTVTLISELAVTQDHSNWYHSKACVRFPIRLP